MVRWSELCGLYVEGCAEFVTINACGARIPGQHSLKQDKDKSTCTLHIFTQGLRMIPPNRVEAAVPKSWASYGGMAA